MAIRKKVASWELNDAKQAVSDAVAAVPLGEQGYTKTYEMIERHDFWQSGKGWAGQRGGGDAVVEARILGNVKPMFVVDDVVGELVENVENGLLAQEPSVGFQAVEQPDDPEGDQAVAQRKRGDQMVEAVSRWWDEKKFWERIGETVRRAAWAGRSPLRLRIAAANLRNGAFPTGLTLAEALSVIELDAPLPDQATVFVDPDTERRVGVVVSKVNDRETAEVWTIEGRGRQQRQTKVRILNQLAASRGAPQELDPIDLGGRLPVFELETASLIPEPMRMAQNQLNYFRTVLSRAVEASGFKARFLGNVEPPLMWLDVKPTTEPIVRTDTTTGRTLYGIRSPWVFGADKTTELLGVLQEGADGSKTNATPSVTIDEPTDTSFVTNPADRVRHWMYKTAKQGHLGGTSTAETSGDAYEQARAQHEADLKKRKGPTEGVIRDVIETVIALASLMTGEVSDFLEQYRCVVNLHVSAGPIRPDTARLQKELHDAGLISRETAMNRIGVDDTAAEVALLDQDEMVQMSIEQRRASVISALTNAGFEVHVAAHLAGMDRDAIEALLTGVIPGMEDLNDLLPEPEPEPDPNADPNNPPAPAPKVRQLPSRRPPGRSAA